MTRHARFFWAMPCQKLLSKEQHGLVLAQPPNTR
nr:MAG TPA: hypothetical protein [Caudoviricetes sp.]